MRDYLTPLAVFLALIGVVFLLAWGIGRIADRNIRLAPTCPEGVEVRVD